MAKIARACRENSLGILCSYEAVLQKSVRGGNPDSAGTPFPIGTLDLGLRSIQVVDLKQSRGEGKRHGVLAADLWFERVRVFCVFCRVRFGEGARVDIKATFNAKQ